MPALTASRKNQTPLGLFEFVGNQVFVEAAIGRPQSNKRRLSHVDPQQTAGGRHYETL
ncbi:MAG: hypothetical protein FWE84_00170 [Firmicutes bacterium]|nr:hypothetical protein [Bacillota bacterium]